MKIYSKIKNALVPIGWGYKSISYLMSKRGGMCWAQRLKRVFDIDVSICSDCGGPMKIIACIEGPFVIGKILYHLENRCRSHRSVNDRPVACAPPSGACDRNRTTIIMYKITRYGRRRLVLQLLDAFLSLKLLSL